MILSQLEIHEADSIFQANDLFRYTRILSFLVSGTLRIPTAIQDWRFRPQSEPTHRSE